MAIYKAVVSRKRIDTTHTIARVSVSGAGAVIPSVGSTTACFCLKYYTIFETARLFPRLVVQQPQEYIDEIIAQQPAEPTIEELQAQLQAIQEQINNLGSE